MPGCRKYIPYRASVCLNSMYDLTRLLTWHSGKESACQCRRCKRCRFISGSERFPGGGNGNPPQYSCLENSMDSRTLQAIVHGVAKSQTRLSTHTHTWSYKPVYLETAWWEPIKCLLGRDFLDRVQMHKRREIINAMDFIRKFWTLIFKKIL